MFGPMGLDITRLPDLALGRLLLLLVPNGAYLGNDLQQRHITMARMKRQGFRNGVFDYILPVPRAPYPGLWIGLTSACSLGDRERGAAAVQSRHGSVGLEMRHCAGLGGRAGGDYGVFGVRKPLRGVYGRRSA